MMTKIEPNYTDDAVTLYAGDCLDVLPTLPDNSVDSVCTDPPYGLEFMGKEWDAPWQKRAGTGGHNAGFDQTGFTDGYQRLSRPSYTGSTNPGCLNCGGKRHGRNPEQRKVCTCDEPRFQNVTLPRMVAFQQWCQLWAAECLRVLRPGGHLLAFGGTRTWHRLAVAIEDAGFEIRDSIAWLYGSGFPKSLDVSKAIDRQRNDRPDIVRVTSWLKAQATARGFTRGEIDQHMGTSDMAGWWLTDLPHRCQCPTWEQWEILRRFMGLPDDMDAEVWRLNGRKGQPGEAWDQREVLGESAFTSRRPRPGAGATIHMPAAGMDTAPATDAAQQWQGWGTALKPAHEPIVVARKPLVGTVAANVQRWGTGALNIAATRISSQPGSAGSRSGGSSVCTCLSPEDDRTNHTPSTRRPASSGASPVGHSDPPPNGAAGALDSSEPLGSLAGYPTSPRSGGEPLRLAEADGQAFARPLGDAPGPLVPRAAASRTPMGQSTPCPHHTAPNVEGRWPANVALDETAAAALDQQSGEQRDGVAVRHNGVSESNLYGAGMGALPVGTNDLGYGAGGGASRFFYTAKAGSDERITHDGIAHATVKPLSLMRWLVRLVTPPGGLILEPFAGSGTTVEAALLEGFRCIAIEREPDYLPLITQRINRRRDPIAYLTAAGEDLGLFGEDAS